MLFKQHTTLYSDKRISLTTSLTRQLTPETTPVEMVTLEM